MSHVHIIELASDCCSLQLTENHERSKSETKNLRHFSRKPKRAEKYVTPDILALLRFATHVFRFTIGSILEDKIQKIS